MAVARTGDGPAGVAGAVRLGAADGVMVAPGVVAAIARCRS